MNLFHAVPFWLHLLGALVEASNLPKLPNNELLVGKARYPPGAVVLRCGALDVVTGTAQKYQIPSNVITPANFAQYTFTAAPVLKVSGNESTFSYAEIKGKRIMQALQEDRSGETAYWIPQGGVVDVPKKPAANEPKYVFTADFSGCSWTVTPMANGDMRLRHVEGGKEVQQFNSLTVEQKGGATTYAMQFLDYGYVVEGTQLLETTRAFAYMHYDGTEWTLNLQRQSCGSVSGAGYKYNGEHLLTKMNVVEPHRITRKPIASTRAYTIPFQ